VQQYLPHPLQEPQAEEQEAALQEMRHAKTIEDRVNVYRKLLQTDPRIAHLQILDMNRPLPLSNVYVAVRLHQESRLKSEIDSALKDAEAEIDPNIALRAEQEWLETRASSSLELTNALQADVHCAFIGDPGAGKTTLLKHLALKSVQSQLPGMPY
jgi:predicted NACHT family NTPase